MKKIISIVLIVAIMVSAGSTAAFAKPNKDKGNMPPGQIKKMILNSKLSDDEVVELIEKYIDSLSPGVLKEIIIKANLSQDTIEEMKEEGLLGGLPGGVLNELLGYEDDDKYDEDEQDDDEDELKEVEGKITGIDIEDKILEIDEEEYELSED
uniref:hypothetical protein n=1 Tax=Sporosalibacterium faouarense TaxID=516123 RepID=UPI00192B090A